jgi:hypothetical protein
MRIWIFHPNRAAGGINRVSDSVKKISALAGESTFSEFGVARRFPGYGFFLAFRALGKDFLLCVQVFSNSNFRRDFRVCILFVQFFPFSKVSARFLQRGSSTFPSVRFQLVSFQQGFVCVCVCVGWFCDVRGDFFGQHFQLISFEQGFYKFCVVLRFPWSFWGPAFPAYFLQQVPLLVFH